MKVLITGINGFVGRILHSELLKKNCAVFGMDIMGNSRDVFAADITHPGAVDDIIKKIQPDYVFHLAAIPYVDYNNPTSLYNININGTLNVLKSCNLLNKKPGILIISSSQVYGNVDKSRQPITEEFPISPINHYGASKASAEEIALAFFHEYGLPVTVARPFNHFGLGQSPNFVIPKIVNSFINNDSEIMLGNIEPVRDFLDVRDVVDAYIKISEIPSEGDVFNIASGKGYNIPDIITALEELTGKKLKIVIDKNFIRGNEIFYSIGDAGKLMQRINWKPVYTIKDTLKWMMGK